MVQLTERYGTSLARHAADVQVTDVQVDAVQVTAVQIDEAHPDGGDGSAGRE
jgi:hypothetical protein